MTARTDRELLELAAKAAGYKPARWTDDGTALLLAGVQTPWNPLDENPHSDCMGDALRLAVMLEIAMNPFAGKTVVSNDDIRWFGHEKWDCHDDDPYAATRRAITRAAAEIGGTV